MCRLLGIVSNTPTAFQVCLHDAPRSLACLSHEHADGWGIAIHSSAGGWHLERQPARAADDAQFHALAAISRGELLVAHVRQRTVGATTLANTHPFRHGRWVFAHNGTIVDVDYLRAHCTIRRLRERIGDTDSELLFAFVLSRLDIARVARRPAAAATDDALIRVAHEIAARPSLGASNFLLSDGVALYAHCRGRTLHTLGRERPTHVTGEGSAVALVASEPATDEPWEPVGDGALLRASLNIPRWTTLVAGTPGGRPTRSVSTH